MFVEEVDGPVDAEAAFLTLFGAAEVAFWLDGQVAGPEGARVSHLGDASGPAAHLMRAAAGAGVVEVVPSAGGCAVAPEGTGEPAGTVGGMETDGPAGSTEVGEPAGAVGGTETGGPVGVRTLSGDVLDVLRTRLRRAGHPAEAPAEATRAVAPAPAPGPVAGDIGADASGGPLGGYVGYLGYEIGADCGAEPTGRSAYPDAQWLFVDRLVSIDHDTGRARVTALPGSSPAEAAAQREWVGRTASTLRGLPPRGPAERAAPPAVDPRVGEAHLVRDRDTYLRDVRACLAALRAGESYEICLTNALDLPAPADPLAFYRRLRRANPAPYAAYLRFGDLAVASSSPERFLRVADGIAESRPIKGTAPRGATPAEDAAIRAALAADPKTRAENLMIVDLLRNDLTRVCEVGTVSTHGLMAVETYATVHQMVTTIRGRLAAGVSIADVVRVCFPGGSMTGAPKRRTTQLCAELERAPRGVYSGALGWIGPDAADLAVVIRTAVMHAGRCHIGAGGAIVLDSDPVAEYDEMLLKAAATLRAL